MSDFNRDMVPPRWLFVALAFAAAAMVVMILFAVF